LLGRELFRPPYSTIWCLLGVHWDWFTLFRVVGTVKTPFLFLSFYTPGLW